MYDGIEYKFIALLEALVESSRLRTRITAMSAENEARRARGQAPAYDEDTFLKVFKEGDAKIEEILK